jgi:hypothetical protein
MLKSNSGRSRAKAHEELIKLGEKWIDKVHADIQQNKESK